MADLTQKIDAPLQEFLRSLTDQWIGTLPSDDVAVSSINKSIWKKFVPGRTRDPALRAKALHTFLETETLCRATNTRISRFLHGKISHDTSYADASVLYTASRKIQRVLGKFDIEQMLTLSRFGPGSTFECRGADISKAKKFGLTDVTPEFHMLARGLLAEYRLWSSFLTDSDLPVCPLLNTVPGNRYLTVAKDDSTDRSILVEPTVNSWFQQGLGRYIRRRMKLVCKVDLDDQTTNQRLAKLGSVSGDLATVDLSSASDLISSKLIEDLLPSDWFFWLNSSRSHRSLVDGQWIELEKFSSMGNGFTFDLQSLVFFCLTEAVVELEGYNPFWVNVFGDDIVLPSGVKDRFLRLFHDLGFQVNQKKSFWEGPFRESCGQDYHLGRNVRGVYCKKLNTLFDVLVLHNRLYDWAIRNSFHFEPLRRTFLFLFEGFEARVPLRLGDVGLASSFDEVCPPFASFGWEGFKVRICTPVFRKEYRYDRFVILSRLQGSQFNGNSNELRYSEGPVRFKYRDTVSVWD